MKIGFVAFVCAVLSLVSCNTSRKIMTTLVPLNDTLYDNESGKVIRDRVLFASVTETVPLDTVYILKDTLHVLTKKVVGCETGNFTLIWNGLKTKSLPPQTSLRLFQQVDGACNERHFFHLIYNMASLRLKSESDSTHKGTKTNPSMIVKLGGWSNPLLYSFDQ